MTEAVHKSISQSKNKNTYIFTNGWLENRTLEEDPTGWDKYNVSLTEHCKNLGLSSDELLYLSNVKMVYKENLVNYIINMGAKEKHEALQNFQGLIEKIDSKLFNKI